MPGRSEEFVVKDSEGILIKLSVVPNSRSQCVELGYEGIVIRLKSPPVKGKANDELVKFLKKLLKKSVSIVSGFTSHEKVVLVRNADTDYVMERLKEVQCA